MTRFLDNKVELIGHYGSDETHALSAWTSTSRELTADKVNRIPKLIEFLAKNGHHTPFEKSVLHFLVTCDTATHIHLLKHRIGVSLNGESARYKELTENKCYLPHDWEEEDRRNYIEWLDQTYERYHLCLRNLEAKGFSRKRAKESARFYLPYGNQLTLDVSFNFRSFMHFQKLRNEEDAQDEIHSVANEMLTQVKALKVFDASLEGFGY